MAHSVVQVLTEGSILQEFGAEEDSVSTEIGKRMSKKKLKEENLEIRVRSSHYWILGEDQSLSEEQLPPIDLICL